MPNHEPLQKRDTAHEDIVDAIHLRGGDGQTHDRRLNANRAWEEIEEILHSRDKDVHRLPVLAAFLDQTRKTQLVTERAADLRKVCPGDLVLDIFKSMDASPAETV